MGWLRGWDYRKSHTLTGSAAGAQANYQVGIKVYYGSGTDGTETVVGIVFGKVYTDSKCRTDFGDIRFTGPDGVTPLDYWIQSKIDSNYAIIWVEVESIPASPSIVDIYIYYGNEVSTTSDGEATFLMFDDFPGTSVHEDWNQIKTGSAYISVSGGIVTLDSVTNNATCRMLREGNGVWGSFALIYRFKYITKYATVAGVGSPVWYVNTYYNRWAMWYKGRQYLYGTANKNWNTMEVRPIGSNRRVYLNGVYITTNTDTFTDTRIDLVSSSQSDAAHGGRFDYSLALVRMYCSPEPTHTAWGSEEYPISGEIPALLIIAPLLVAAFILILSTTKNKARARASHIKSLYR